MSNLAIFLCAVFIASAVNASYVSDALVSAEATVDELILATINATKEKFNDAKSKAAENNDKLEPAAQSDIDKIMQEAMSALNQAEEEIDKLVGKVDGSEITDCKKLFTHLYFVGFAAVVPMGGCLEEKLATGSGYVQNITTLSENVLANLTAIREEARHCGDNINGNVDVDTAVAAIKCVDTAGFKAAWVETNVLPSLMIETTKITNSFATLQASLANCLTNNEFEIFYHEISTVVERTKQCIHDMRHEAGPGTEEVTTENASSLETSSLETTPHTKIAST